jgi:hypothetical protein
MPRPRNSPTRNPRQALAVIRDLGLPMDATNPNSFERLN